MGSRNNPDRLVLASMSNGSVQVRRYRQVSTQAARKLGVKIIQDPYVEDAGAEMVAEPVKEKATAAAPVPETPEPVKEEVQTEPEEGDVPSMPEAAEEETPAEEDQEDNPLNFD